MVRYSLIVCLFMLSAGTALAVPTVDISVEPKTVFVGRSARLTLTVSGASSAPEPIFPNTENLVITHRNTANQFQMIGNNSLFQVVHTYAIRAKKAGLFTIPSFVINVDNIDIETKPVTFEVIQSSEQQPDVIELKLTTNKEDGFVGEKIPVEIKLYAKQNLSGSIRSLPKNTSEDYLDDQLTLKGNGLEDINGEQYQVSTWFTYITPIKSGIIDLEYQLPIELHTRVAPRASRQSIFGGGLDSLFNSMMNVETEVVELTTKKRSIFVRSIPDEDRPESYTGGVGQFALTETEIDESLIHEGEPITLKIGLKGIGNFEAITPPELDLPSDWKVYKPRAYMEAVDDFGYAGTKYFEYVLIPQSQDLTEVPSVEIATFDPEKDKYIKFITKTFPITVKEAEKTWVNNSTAPTVTGGTEPQSSPPSAKIPELVPIKLSYKNHIGSLQPIATKAWFRYAQLIPLVLICGLYFYGKRRKQLAKDVEYVRSKQAHEALRKHLKLIRQAHHKNTAAAFYNASEKAICEVVSKRYTSGVSALTMGDVTDILAQNRVSSEVITQVQTVFETSNLLKFSGSENRSTLTSKELHEVEHLIEKLDR